MRIFTQTLRQAMRPLGFLAAGAALFFFIALWSTASFAADLGQVPVFAEPPRVIRAFLGSADFLTPQGWLSIGLGHPVSLSLFAAGALTVAAGAVATEIERGTIELVLSRPISRISFLGAKAVAALVGLTLVQLGGLAGTFIAKYTVQTIERLEPAQILRGFLGSWTLFTAFTMVATWVSARSSLRGRAISISVGILVGSFFINVIALLAESLYWMRFASLFHYAQPDDLIRGQSFTPLLVPIVVSVVAAAAALLTFQSRDISR